MFGNGFGNDRLARPRTASLVLALVVAVVVFFLMRVSPMISYFIALMTLVVIVITSYTDSMWATKAKQENIITFSAFWGLIIGAVLPFIINTYLQGGISSLIGLLLD